MRSRSKVLILLVFSWMISVPVYADKVSIKQMVSVRFGSQLSSATAHEGASWSATLAQDLIIDGKPYAHAGDKVIGTVLAAHPGAGPESRGTLKLRLQSINGVQVESGTVTRSVLGAINQANQTADAMIAAGDVISFYVISFG